MASYEYPEASKRWPQQIGFGAIGLTCLGGVFFLLRRGHRLESPTKAFTEKEGRYGVGLFVVAGFIAGAAIPCASIWPDFSRSLHRALSGGGGESSDWGEPLSYMVVQGVPAGLIGGAIAFAIGLTIRELTNSNL